MPSALRFPLRAIGMREALGSVLGLVCALALLSGPLPGHAQTPAVQATATATAAQIAMLLDQFAAQSQLRKARQVFLLEEDNEDVLREVSARQSSLVAAGVARGVDDSQAKAALAESSIAMQEASAAYSAARLRYEARFGGDLPGLQAQLPSWGDRLPTSLSALLAAVPEAGQEAARQAWLRMQRAQVLRSLQDERVLHLEKVRDAYQQQFDIGQKPVTALIQAQFTLRDAKVAALGAEGDVLQAQAAVMALAGRLQASDLLLTPAASRPATPWLFDPDDPRRDASGRQLIDHMRLKLPTPISGLFGSKGNAGRNGGPGSAPTLPTKPGKEGSRPAKDAAHDDPEDAAPAAAMPGGDTPPVRSPSHAAKPADDDDSLPKLPWPPAPASAEAEIPSGLLRPAMGTPTLGDAARTLQAALRGADYENGSYAFLAVPNGFAIVSRMEQIRPDGEPTTPRWNRAINVPLLADAGLMGLIESLYKAPVGHYRVIVFVVTDAPRDHTGQALGEAAMDKLLKIGKNELPKAIGDKPYTPQTKTVALIYEFAKSSDKQPAQFVSTPQLSGDTHLTKAHILQSLMNVANAQ